MSLALPPGGVDVISLWCCQKCSVFSLWGCRWCVMSGVLPPGAFDVMSWWCCLGVVLSAGGVAGGML